MRAGKIAAGLADIACAMFGAVISGMETPAPGVWYAVAQPLMDATTHRANDTPMAWTRDVIPTSLAGGWCSNGRIRRAGSIPEEFRIQRTPPPSKGGGVFLCGACA